MDVQYSIFNKKPSLDCPVCNASCDADWVDNGFGPYAVQVSPWHCFSCGWVETGCPADKCIRERCFSWQTCQGKAIVNDNGEENEKTLSF